MHRLLAVVSGAVCLAWAGAAFAARPAGSSPQPVAGAAEQRVEPPPAPGAAGPKTGRSVPFEDPTQTKADVPPRQPDTNNLATLNAQTTIAEVNGQPVTLADLNRLIEFGDANLKAELSSGDAAKKELLNNYLESRALYFEALENGVDQDADLRGRLELVRQQMFANAYLGKEMQEISAPEEELRQYYEEHPKEFEIPENVNASHILVRTEQEAWEIKKQLQQGADFAELARQKSLDTTNKNIGGNLGFIVRGAMLPAFDEAAFRLKIGEISDPVQTSFGYHIIKVLQVRPREIQPFDQARRVIEARVVNRKQNEWLKNKRDEIRSKYKVRIYEKYFSAPSSSRGESETDPSGQGADPKTGPSETKNPALPEG
ncbi:MAG: peptidyl-prolyl cis-trans isomerase [Acidobacteria bacterium]|nr:peptidyl-prolyl cis-trans isomerase [Acidobacteriota bacterium]